MNESGSLQHFFYALLIPRGDKPSAEPAAPGATSPTLSRCQQCGLPHFMCVNLFKPTDMSSCQSGQRLFKRGVVQEFKSGCETTLIPPPLTRAVRNLPFYLPAVPVRAEQKSEQQRGALIIWAGGRIQTRATGLLDSSHLWEPRKTSLLGGFRMCARALWEQKESHLYSCSFSSCPTPFIK